jgi:hypothetical protein
MCLAKAGRFSINLSYNLGMRIPYFIQGALFAPAFVGLVIILKIFCPASAGATCFADHLAVPIFLPLILVYTNFGGNLLVIHEFWFVLVYWAVTGFLIGLILDLRVRKGSQMTNTQ